MSRPVIVLGGGGHASVVISALQSQEVEIAGYTAPVGSSKPPLISGVEWIGDDNVLANYPADRFDLAVGLGSTGDCNRRKTLFELFHSSAYRFPPVIHASAVISAGVVVGEASQIFSGAVVQPGSRLGKNVCINTGSIIDHDCQIGDHSHVSPGSVLGGGVIVGDCCHIGIGATLIQEIQVGADSLIAAGSVVIRDVPASSRVAGVPSQPMKSDAI